jgi:7-cyano-7-deazaguanine synthase
MLLSGGVDSATLLYHLLARNNEVYALSVDYGQKHSKELEAATAIAQRAMKKTQPGMNVLKEHRIINLSVLQPLLQSALTRASIDVPEGHYEAESMKATVVPNRNAILLNIAAGYALSLKADRIAYAAHAGDHAIYPDCREEFVVALEKAINIGNESKLEVYAPFIAVSKSDIVRMGLKLGVPYELTWSCYKGGYKACGKCGTCVERLEAFANNNTTDPIEYEG